MTWTLKTVGFFACLGAAVAFAIGWVLASFFDQYDDWRDARQRRIR